jgi:hypothetical protein
MRPLLTSILFIITIGTIAQKSFEGIIHYEFTVKKDSTARVDMTAYFKEDKIKLVATVAKPIPGMDLKNETLIINFKDATIDRFKPETKVVERERMKPGKKQDIPELMIRLQNTRNILKHLCTEFTTGPFSKEEVKDSATITTKGEIKIFYANDLIFPVEDSLKMIQMVPLFTNGNIALKTEIKIEQGPIVIVVACEAKQIEAVPNGLPDSVFEHPKDYGLKFNE